jgi:uncharacterized membrane protein YkgB
MRKLLGYFYCHFYHLIARYRPLNAREAAILYLSAIEFFILFPIIGHLIFYIFGKGSIIPFLVIMVLFGFLLRAVNAKYLFKNKDLLTQDFDSYNNETKRGRIIGYIASICLLIISPIIGIYLLSML